MKKGKRGEGKGKEKWETATGKGYKENRKRETKFQIKIGKSKYSVKNNSSQDLPLMTLVPVYGHLCLVCQMVITFFWAIMILMIPSS